MAAFWSNGATRVNGLLATAKSRGGGTTLSERVLHPSCRFPDAVCAQGFGRDCGFEMTKNLYSVPSSYCRFLTQEWTLSVSTKMDGLPRSGGPPLPRPEYASGIDEAIDPVMSDDSTTAKSKVIQQTDPHRNDFDVNDGVQFHRGWMMNGF